MPEVQNTTYLSIGEVLGLLLEEFPDITISKIRFLESQGLIAPERTPSGYRKFYEPDVEHRAGPVRHDTVHRGVAAQPAYRVRSERGARGRVPQPRPSTPRSSSWSTLPVPASSTMSFLLTVVVK